MKTKKLVQAALLVALSIVMTRLFPTSYAVALFGLSPLTVRFAFGLIPIYLASVKLGWGYGACVAALADLIGYLINPMGGAYMPVMTLVAALGGAICGWIVWKKGSLWRIALGIFAASTITALLNTYCLQWLYDMDFALMIWPRLISAALMSVIYIAAVYALNRLFHRIGE